MKVASSERTHIGFFGLRNAGKSSVVNAITGQNAAVVSDVKGTTTDPVRVGMELLPLGAVTILDTPGIDDEGVLGDLRTKRTTSALYETDIAVLVTTADEEFSREENDIIDIFKTREIPYIVVCNKCDLTQRRDKECSIFVSAVTGEGITELKEMIASLGKENTNTRTIVKDFVAEKDIVILVIPIDESAPKGRIILPQQQTLRELLESNCITICCKEEELADTLDTISKKPKVVITDSQIFKKVSEIVPDDILLTSFSVLFANYKGNLKQLLDGVNALDNLEDNDKVLICESCTHHRQCNDIGSVKLPGWIKKYTEKNIEFSFASGKEFPDNITDYKLILHCGGCMLTETAMKNRLLFAKENGIPIVNYGLAIAQMNGILQRSTKIFAKDF